MKSEEAPRTVTLDALFNLNSSLYVNDILCRKAQSMYMFKSNCAHRYIRLHHTTNPRCFFFLFFSFFSENLSAK